MASFVELARRELGAPVRQIVDVGAYDGADTRFLVDQYPDAVGLAIEGDPETFNLCNAQCAGTRVVAVNAIIAAAAGPVQWGRQSAPVLNGIYDRGFLQSTHELPARPLADVLAERGIRWVDLMKIDVEGAALDVLEGLGPALDRVVLAHVEAESEQHFKGARLQGEVFAFLEARGWTMLAIHDDAGQSDSVWLNRAAESQRPA